MRLKKASRFFDTCPVYDAYSGLPLFKIQTSTFLESSAEGSTAAKRVISLDPDIVLPAHSCILALGQIWITGASNPDEWNGTAIRKAYWTKLATDNLTLLTPGQAASSAVGQALFGSKAYLRDSLNGGADAQLDPVWDISISANTVAPRGYFLKSANTLYRIRISYQDVDGFKTCQSDEIDEPVTGVVFTTSATYNPVSDTYAPVLLSVTAITLDYAKTYEKISTTDIKAELGDICMIVEKTAVTVATGQSLTINSGKFKGTWRVLSVLSEHDAWNLHIRRV
jgi:hypothetical protein